MPFNARRTATLFEKEILRSAAGLDDIKSMVIDSTKIDQNPSSSGRYVLEAGNVMVKIPSSSKIMPIAAAAASGQGSGGSGAYVAADIVGILGSAIEFFIGQGVTASGATDEPASILHHGCDFNVGQLLGYTGNEAITAAAMPTCKFR